MFVGDSITDLYVLDDHYADLPQAVYNRGIGGDTTAGVLARLQVSVLDLQPDVVVLMIGTNDLKFVDAYSAAKGAIEAFTRSLALESIRKNITVNAIGPGMIDTDMFRGIPEDIRLGRIKDHPAQRVAQPSEVANLAAFLASEDASWVTGNIIMVSGGQKLRT